MSVVWTLLGGIWGRVAAVLVAVVAILGTLASIRYRIRKGAKEEIEGQIMRRTIERMGVAKDEREKVDIESADDTNAWMREHGFFRD